MNAKRPSLHGPGHRYLGHFAKPSVVKAGHNQSRPDEEAAFQEWYKTRAAQQGTNSDPDDPRHFYDYRAAYQAGVEPDASGHWPSAFKREGHPNLIVDGVNTKTGKRVR